MSSTLEDLAKPDFEPKTEKVELIPFAYEKNEKGIFKKQWIENKKDGTKELILIPLSYTPFDIAKKLTNPDTQQVSFEIVIGSYSFSIPASELASKKGVLVLAGHGINTVEAKAKELCNFIMEYRNINPLPEAVIYDRFGWKPDGGFVLGKIQYFKDSCHPVSLTRCTKETEAIHQRGTREGWLKAIKGMMEYDTQRFKMYVGASAPILKILNEPSQCLNDYGDTSWGKTKTSQCVMSMYGQPFDLTFAGDTTWVGMERMVTQFCDLPVLIDDAQNVEEKLRTKLIYTIANGRGKIRGDKEGGIQEILTWRSVGFFTSESPMLTETSFGGAGARLIETNNGLGVKNDTVVNRFKELIKENYGLFAPLLVRYILTHENEITALHEKSKERLSTAKNEYSSDKNASGIANRLADIYATILTAGKIFERLYLSIGGEQKNPEDIVVSRFKADVEKQGGETYTSRGLNHILSWIAANYSYFLVDGERRKDIDGTAKLYKTMGDITPTHYYILPTELKAELEKAKFSPDRLISDFLAAGYLETDNDQKQKRGQKTKKIEGVSKKTYALIREKIEKCVPDNERGVK